jgi:hypothetical protein
MEFGLIPSVQGNGDNVAVTIVTPDTTTSCGADSVYMQPCSGSPEGSAHAVAVIAPPARMPVVAMAARSLRHRIMLGYYKRIRTVIARSRWLPRLLTWA